MHSIPSKRVSTIGYSFGFGVELDGRALLHIQVHVALQVNRRR